MPQHLVPDGKGRPQRGPVVPCRRLDIDFLEWRLLSDFAIQDAVHGAPPRQAKPGEPRPPVQRVEDVEGRLFKDRLQRGRNGLVPWL